MERPSWPGTIFGEQLRQFRKAAGVTQEELAFRAGLDRTYISLLERGMKSPTLSVFFRLCNVLAISPVEFISLVHAHMVETEREDAPFDAGRKQEQ